METPSFKEDHISQIPALEFLQNLEYGYISPDEALRERNGKTSGVLLEGILKKQLTKINTIRYKGGEYKFTEGAIKTGIEVLKDIPLQDGYIHASKHIYDLITLGQSFEQTIEGDKKSHSLKYIDWENWGNNSFHVTEEFSVLRSGSHDHYWPDIVLFVNGIPLVVIECKRPDIKDSLKQAIEQNLRNQLEDGIRTLYSYSQIVMGISVNDASYATTATAEKFWHRWREQFGEDDDRIAHTKEKIKEIKSHILTNEQKDRLFAERFRYVWKGKKEQ